MSLHPNSELLRQALESTALLDGRFSKIRLVNVTSAGVKRGCFSLVFKAFDEAEKKPVALKFYDLDPQWRNDAYRLAGFKREHEILQGLLSAERCLQLASAMSTYQLAVNVPGVQGVTIPCDYFAVEWLDEEIDAYFLTEGVHSAVGRLKLFHEIVLCVEALHRHEVFHRDLKPDNLRARSYQNTLKRMVVAIDLGTAARFDSGLLAIQYGSSVGAPAYAAPEAHVGLAGNRTLAPFTDSWALGCLLFELFNPELFARAWFAVNPQLQVRLSAMAGIVAGTSDQAGQVKKWNEALGRFGKGVTPVAIDGAGSWVPRGIAPLLNELLSVLTNFDYRNRDPGRGWVSQRVQTALHVLQNQADYARRLQQAKQRREKRQLAARLKRQSTLRLPVGGTDADT